MSTQLWELGEPILFHEQMKRCHLAKTLKSKWPGFGEVRCSRPFCLDQSVDFIKMVAGFGYCWDSKLNNSTNQTRP